MRGGPGAVITQLSFAFHGGEDSAQHLRTRDHHEYSRTRPHPWVSASLGFFVETEPQILKEKSVNREGCIACSILQTFVGRHLRIVVRTSILGLAVGHRELVREM